MRGTWVNGWSLLIYMSASSGSRITVYKLAVT